MPETFKTPLVSDLSVGQTLEQGNSRMINLFPVVNESGWSLERSPGVIKEKHFEGYCYALYSYNEHVFCVFSEHLVVIDKFGKYEKYEFENNIINFNDITFSGNNDYMVFTFKGGKSYYYSYNEPIIKNRLKNVDKLKINPLSVFYLDSRWYYVYYEDYKIKASNINNPNEFKDGQKTEHIIELEGLDGKITNVFVFNSLVYVFSRNSFLVLRDTSKTGDFFLSRINSVRGNVGCINTNSYTIISQRIFFLGNSQKENDGGISLYVMSGVIPQKVSNPIIDNLINPINPSLETVLWSHQHLGHNFVCINTNKKTSLIYDVDTGVWHERAMWNSEKGDWDGFNVVASCSSITKDYISFIDREGLYHLSSTIFKDPIGPQRWLRRWKAMSDSFKYGHVRHNRLSIIFNSGNDNNEMNRINPYGITDYKTGSITLRYSDDAGYTWSSGRRMSTGRYGQHGVIIKWYSLGYTKGNCERIYEISGSSESQKTIISAWLELSR